MGATPRTIDDLPTPFVYIDLARLRRNIHCLAEAANDAGIALRPHVKTHKLIEIAKMQMEAGACGLTAAKITEAEPFINAGVSSMLIAFPVWDEVKIQRLIELEQQTAILIGVDTPELIQRMGETARGRGTEINALLIVDTGYGRFGASMDDAPAAAATMARTPGIRFCGIKTYHGGTYKSRGLSELEHAAEKEVALCRETANAIRRAGVEVEIVSAGTTPTSQIICRSGLKGVTELRPGNYVFFDRMQMEIGVAAEDDCALRVFSTVVSKPAKNRMLVDAGSKTLSTSGCPGATGHGLVVDKQGVEIYSVSEEAGWVRLADNGNKVEIGERLEIIPNHACEVTNLAEQVYAGTNGSIEKIWSPEARGKVV